jgi:hypothetical protein
MPSTPNRVTKIKIKSVTRNWLPLQMSIFPIFLILQRAILILVARQASTRVWFSTYSIDGVAYCTFLLYSYTLFICMSSLSIVYSLFMDIRYETSLCLFPAKLNRWINGHVRVFCLVTEHNYQCCRVIEHRQFGIAPDCREIASMLF